MIHVCDAIMGTGKSSAAITYMNEHPEFKFIYITPYLDEAARIREACPELNLIEPKNLDKYDNSKVEHTHRLIEEGCNIATTHAAFKSYSPDMLEMIREGGYVLIIDENVDVIDNIEVMPDDIQLALDAGYISEHDGTYELINDKYNGELLRNLFQPLKSRELFRLEGDNKGELFYWVLPQDLMNSFREVFILTYLFRGQSLHHFMEIYNIEYDFIGIQRDEDGTFRFGDYPGYTPEYVAHLDEMIDIYDGDMNDIGNNFHALSASWFDRSSNTKDIETLKKNMYNYFRWKNEDVSAVDRMWSTYKGKKDRLKGKGYSSKYLNFNVKATNEYRNRKCMIYAVNIFMNVNEKKFYNERGITVDEGEYALSIMVQWIWRSAIRDGEQIHIYLPSRRMRELLQNWIERTMKGGNTVEQPE